MRKLAHAIVFLILLGSMSIGLDAQTKRTKRTNKTKPVASATPQPTQQSTPVENSTKRNERPNNGNPNSVTKPAFLPGYFYEFTRPGFMYERVLIEHDEAGKGTISFGKNGFDELVTDPIMLTPVTLANLNAAFLALNFLDSNENYQTERDHSNMGNVSITIKKDGRSRNAKFNWTENKQAKFLMDEYRRVSNEYTWKFEITVARQNQPLQAPSLMDTFDNYIRQNEISDPAHLIPLLSELSTDERIPLIARDHAARIVKQIEKAKK